MFNRFLAYLASAVLLFAGLLSIGGIARAQDQEEADERAQQLEVFPPGVHGGTHLKGYAKHGQTGPSNLIDHGGPLLLAPTGFHFVWWGNPSSFTPEKSILQKFVSGIGATSLFTMMDQYTRLQGVVGLSYPGVDFTDLSAPPSHGPSVSTIVGEVCKVLTAAGTPPSSFDMYAVLTSNFPKGANYCAWHSSGSCNGVPIQVIYHPNPAGVSGCSTGVYPNGSPQADSTANTLSHEIFETVSDPRGTAWYDQNGQEIADKCEWTFIPTTLNNITYTNQVGQSYYYIQQEWSNKVSGCVQNP